MVLRCSPRTKPGLSAGTRNIVAPSGASSPSFSAMTIEKAAPSAPVMSHFSPLTTQPPATRRARVCRAIGSEPAPGGGSVMEKQERTSPATSGARYFACCSGVPVMCSRWMLPSSGAAQLSATGPSRL